MTKRSTQAGNPEDRVCGLQSLANLTASAEVRQLVLEGRLVRIAGPLLLDEDEMVRQAAAGALRCLSCVQWVLMTKLPFFCLFQPIFDAKIFTHKNCAFVFCCPDLSVIGRVLWHLFRLY